MSSSPSRLPRSTALLLALGLAAGCASASGGAEGPDAADGADTARADGGPTCQDDCWLRVDNRLRRDGEVSTARLSALPDLGIVRANATESSTWRASQANTSKSGSATRRPAT